MIRDKLYGEFTADERADFNSLLLELQKLNGGPLPKRKMVSCCKIKPLSPEKNERLWKYILHSVKLFLMLHNRKRQVEALFKKNPYNDRATFIDELQMDLAPFVYKYIWRRYHETEKPEGYAITTALYGWVTYLTANSNNMRMVPLNELEDIVTNTESNILGIKKSSRVNNKNSK